MITKDKVDHFHYGMKVTADINKDVLNRFIDRFRMHIE